MFFLGSYMVYKRQLLFVYEPEYETGGTHSLGQHRQGRQ